MKTRICTSVIVIALVFTSFSFSFAGTDQAGTTYDSPPNDSDEIIYDLAEEAAESQAQEEEIIDDLYALEEVGFDATYIEEIDCDNEEVVYEISLGEDHLAEVTVEEDAGDIILDISEGELHDELTMAEDGSIYLDGEEVIIEEEVLTDAELEAIEADGATVEGMAMHRLKWSKTPGYGKAGDYSRHVNTVKKNIKFKKHILDLTDGAILVVLGLAFPGYGTIVFYGVTAGIKSYAKYHDPYSSACSMIDKKYVHSKKGFKVSAKKSIEKHVITYYAKINYKTKLGTATWFAIFSY